MKNNNFSKSIFSKVSFILFSLFVSNLAYAQSAEQAWNSLLSIRFEKMPEFSYVENNPKLPNILIYGDSISIHYTDTVRETLLDKANVYRINLNGGDSSTFAPKMTKMHKTMQDPSLTNAWSFNWDVIHFNVGLHDLKYLKDRTLNKVSGKQVNSIEQYENNLRNIVTYLKKLAPMAKLIFATTTPIPEGELGRVAGDAVKYNRAALKVLKAFPEVVINDLYTFTKPNHAAWWQAADNVHYNKIGRKAQGNEVALNIWSQLQIMKKNSTPTDLENEEHNETLSK